MSKKLTLSVTDDELGEIDVVITGTYQRAERGMRECGVQMDTPETHEQAKINRDNPFWSAAYEDVMRRTGECIQLRSELAAALAAIKRRDEVIEWLLGFYNPGDWKRQEVSAKLKGE